MRLGDLQYLSDLFETLNFRETAAVFSVSQSTISRAIARLEDYLGNQLFSREGKKVLLSTFGREMRPHLRLLTTNLEGAELKARSFLRAEEGRIRIGIDNSAPFTLVQPLLDLYAQKMPTIELDFTHDTPDQLGKALLNADLDCMIATMKEDFDATCKNVAFAHEPFVIAAPESYEEEASSFPLQSLLSSPLVINRLSVDEAHLFALNAKMKLKPPLICRCERSDWQVGLVRAGFGYGILPRSLTAPAGLKEIYTLHNEIKPYSLSLITVRGRAFTPMLRTLNFEATLLAQNILTSQLNQVLQHG